MIVYKVVTEVGGTLFSISINSDHAIVYTPGQLTKPWVGKLLVFPLLEDAEGFYRRSLRVESLQIWEGEADNARPIPHLALRAFDISRFWAGDLSGMYTFDAPLGTCGVDSITLTRRLK